MRRAVLMILLAVVSSSAIAEWVAIVSNETKTTYADPATIRRAGDRAKMWSLIDLKTAETAINGVMPFMSSRAQYEYDCKEEQSRILYLSFHSGNMSAGEIVYRSPDTRDKWSSIPPDSVTETLWKIACGKR